MQRPGCLRAPAGSRPWHVRRIAPVQRPATADGNNVTSDFDNYVLTLTSDGDATLLATYTVFGADFTFDTNGTWNFQNSDEELVMDFENDAADGTYQIRRLTETQLWLRQVGDDLELHLKTQ